MEDLIGGRERKKDWVEVLSVVQNHTLRRGKHDGGDCKVEDATRHPRLNLSKLFSRGP